MEGKSKIEIVRVPSNERGTNFRSLDGVRNNYSHIRVGTYYPEPEVKVVVCDSKPPIEQSRKFKKHLGPVSKLLRRRHHATYLATKSCDNIYSVNRSNSSLDWRVNQTANEKGLQSRQSNSLDWRVGRSINKLHWRDTTRSAEQLSRSGAISSDHLQTPSTKSKLISLLRRLSPRLSRPGSKNSLQASPTICPWVQVEYSSESINDGLREDSQENDVSFQRELQLNELRKRMAGIPTTSQVTTKVVKDGKGQQSCSAQIRIQVQEPENDYTNASNSVHEDRGDEDRRRASGQTRGGGEVAGLEDVGDCCAATLMPSVPGAAGIRSNRRTRPLSLAVQPLNYRRLDPDPKIGINTIVTSHHPNMTSQESIGSCSLDVDQSASDRSENTIDTISKKTLHSLNLSCNGDSVSSSDNLANGSSETLQKSHLTPDEKLNVSNGHRSSPEPEQLTVKKPSYLGLACSISGYSGINRYDSKLREGFRSRDSSPGTRLITRDTSPASFRSNEYLNVPAHPHPPKSQSISPLAMDRQNGFSNGLKEECKVEAYRESRNSIGIYQGYSEVDKGVLTTFPEISPVISSTPTKRSPGVSQMMSCSQQQNKHFSVTSPKRDAASLASASLNETNVLNGSTEEVGSQVITNTPSSEKSFIQQRVERLYGPGALAQGFFFKRSNTRLNTSDNVSNKSSNNNDVSVENANTEESLKNLPVLRHLRPEFRAQLPVVSPRRPTDGSEQILKPLQRVSPVSRKVEQKPKIPAAASLDGNLTDSNAQELSSSVTSIPDQQPAAPKVVLPVLESSASSTNVAKQVQEAEKTVEEKNGHYFMKLLKQETDRLLSLAALAEAELSSSGDSVPLPEEAAGKLRSAAGKARLLASQKMQQFEGLCQKNINQVPGEEFPTTNEDLAGFWDMVMLQVVQVNELFDQIEKLRSSQWQEVRSVSVHPQTIDSLKPVENNFYPHENSVNNNVKPAELPNRKYCSQSVTAKRVRFDDKIFVREEKPNYVQKDSSASQIQFPLEARLCDDVFQGLNIPQNLEKHGDYCEDNDLDYESDPFLCENINEMKSIENDTIPLNPCTSYVINYVKSLQPDVNSFYFENVAPSYDKYNLYSDDDFLEKDFSRKFEVIYKKQNDEVKQKKDYCDKGQSNSFTKSRQNNVQEKKSSAHSGGKNISQLHKKAVPEEKKLENVRPKAKSCSPVGRIMNNETNRRARSHTPEIKPPQKSNLIKSRSGDVQKPFSNFKSMITRKREEKVSIPSKNDKFPYKSFSPRKENVKNVEHNGISFPNDIKESSKTRKNGLSVDQKSEKITNDKVKDKTGKLCAINVLHGKLEKNFLAINKKNVKKINHCKKKCNFSIVRDMWSNLDVAENKYKSQSKLNTSMENCTFFGIWKVKKELEDSKKERIKERMKVSPKKGALERESRKEQIKELSKKMEQESRKEQIKQLHKMVKQEAEVSSETSDNIVWRLSDSKPFIPLSQETLRQLRQVYNIEHHLNLSANLSKSEKLERMKVYDKKRKENGKFQEDEFVKKCASITSNCLYDASEDNIPDASLVNLQDDLKSKIEILNPISEVINSIPKSRDFSIQCLISNLTPDVTETKNESNFFANNIADNITKLSKTGEIQSINNVVTDNVPKLCKKDEMQDEMRDIKNVTDNISKLFKKNDEIQNMNNVANDIPKLSKKNDEIQNFLSTLMSSLSADIVSKVANRNASKLKNNLNIKKLSYGLIAKNIKSSDVDANVVMDISQHVHSDFVIRPLFNQKTDKNIKSINLNNYLPLKKGFHGNPYFEELKYMQLFPDNIEIHSNSPNAKNFLRMRHIYTFLKSNRTLCRLSLYLYVYGILSLVLIFLKIGCYILNPNVLYNFF